MGDENKQFEASAQKLKKAKKYPGNVFKSKDLSTSVILVLMFMFLFQMAPFIWKEIAALFIVMFEQIPNKSLEQIGWQYLLIVTLKTTVLLIAPFIIVAAMLAIGADFFQVGPLIAVKAISPKFDKLNPVKGFQNIFSQKSLIELIKNIIKVSVMGYLAYMVFQEHLGALLAVGATGNIFVILGVLGNVFMQFVIKAGGLFFGLGMADFLYQRWKYMQDQKMSFKEVKDEYKQNEGDPMVKQAIRQRRMQMLQQGMLEAVPTADVITTNPIHIAVALKYNADVMEAPRVVAKGTELFAEQIKTIARQHNVPIIENPVVARTLFKIVDIDQEIPPDLYQAVAEILMTAWQIQGKSLPGKPSSNNQNP